MTMNDVRWYENPDRVCNGDERYADLALTEHHRERVEMMLGCLECPVYFECLDDLLKHKRWTHYGIQAGVQGKS